MEVVRPTPVSPPDGDTWLDRLARLAHDKSKKDVCLGDIVAAAGEGGIAAAILLFALLNTLPSLPGMSSVLGAPLLLLTAQQLLGRPAWVPRWMSRFSIQRVHLQIPLERLGALATWGRASRCARCSAFCGPLATRFAGGFGWVLAVLLVLPLPLVNIPIGIALSLMSFGRLCSDGLLVLLGFAVGIASLGLAVSVLCGAWALL